MELQAPEGPVLMKSHRLLSTSKRLELVADQITELRGQLRMQAGVQVVMVASCGHPECGKSRPADLPEEDLVVELGCGHAVHWWRCPLMNAAVDRGPRDPSPLMPSVRAYPMPGRRRSSRPSACFDD